MQTVRVEVDRAGRLDLHYAAMEGRSDDVHAALATGVDASTPDKQGWTPLHFAAQGQHPDVALSLIRAGAEVDAQDVYGKTPLGVALMNVLDGDGAVVTVLLAAGADPGLKNKSGIGPLDLAKKVDNYDLMRFFRGNP